MLNYTGIDCPVCGKEFKDNDDIVVCPDCGAPYHRDCYAEKGQCIFTELHEKGEVWNPPVPEKEEETKPPVYEIKDKECPSCGVLNAHSSLFCSHCGSSLSGRPDSHVNRPDPQEADGEFNPQQPNFPTGFYPGTPFIMDPMGGVKPTETIDGAMTYGEVSKLVQQNTRYYMPVFNRIKAANKSKFNFSAFIFSGGWLLYRKQYKPGIIVTLLMFILYLGQTFLSMFVSLPIMEKMMLKAGIDITTQSATTSQQIAAMTEMFLDNPSDYLLVVLPLLCSIAMLIIMIVVGANANRTYMKHCIRTINKAKAESNNTQDYDTAILAKGGINTSVTFCLIICYFLCTYLPLLI